MSLKKEKLNDKWFRFIGIPLLVFFSHIIFFSDGKLESTDDGFSVWQVYLISILETMVLWEANRIIIAYFRTRYPDLYQSKERIIRQLLICTLVTIFIRFTNIWIYDITLFWGYHFPLDGYVFNICVALLFMIIVGSTYECLYYFRKWKQLFSETEALKRENLQTQLDALKGQINPHFLFNNLGSLSSLIMEDQNRAVLFVNELSYVYRYLLQANDKNLTTLEAELKFLAHYFHLLKTRFGDGIKLIKNIDSEYELYTLPPLTLQILIENAVKHNAILPNKPLLIHLYTDEADNLIVVNNLQRKVSTIASNKLGLRNIITKYRLLKQKDVLIKQTDEVFQVIIPLIKEEIYENSYSRR